MQMNTKNDLQAAETNWEILLKVLIAEEFIKAINKFSEVVVRFDYEFNVVLNPKIVYSLPNPYNGNKMNYILVSNLLS